MAARRVLLPLRRLLLLKNRGHSQCASPGQGPPPCAPCPRTSPPNCRAQPRRTRQALRVTCCAPQPRAAPTCEPQEEQFTCLRARTETEKRKKSSESLCNSSCAAAEPTRCGAELDRVARRLAAAELARRRHYEREAGCPARPAAAPPAAPYRLLPERECVRATDGRDYTLVANTHSDNPCPRCGPDRRPPAPHLTALTPSDACEPDRGLELDPCAHRPRVLLHVDRSPPEHAPAPPTPTSLPPGAERPSSRERLTARIMESLNLKRENKISCPKSSCTARNDVTNRDRCANLPKPVEAPPRCREPSIAEQLRRRPGGAASGRCGDARRLHTSTTCAGRAGPCGAPSGAATSTASTMGAPKNYTKTGLDELLRQRSELKEAAQGRVVRPQSAGGRPSGPGIGQLELRVPPTSEAVRVRVSLEVLPPQPGGCASSATAEAPARCGTSEYMAARALTSGGDDSWLSIRGMQKKLSGYRKHDRSSKNSTAAEAPPARPAGCAPAGRQAAHQRGAGGAGCTRPPCSPPRCSSAPEFPQILIY